jgi:Holliday junction resolvasome RuvABC endonuclease subunit
MSKRIDPTDLIGTRKTNKKQHEYIVLQFIEKATDYLYWVKFIESGNLVKATRKQVLNNTVRDKEYEARQAKHKKQSDYKKLNTKTSKTEIYIDSFSTTRLLAIDQSTTSTGYAIYYDNQLQETGVFQPKSTNTIERISWIRKEVLQLVRKHGITIVVFEDIFLQKNIKVFKVLAFLLGVLQVTCYEQGLEFVSIPAPEWKSGVGILKGTRERQKYLSKVITGIEQEDIADAVLIGYYAWSHALIPQGW